MRARRLVPMSNVNRYKLTSCCDDSVHIVERYNFNHNGRLPMHAGCLTWQSLLMFPAIIPAYAPFLMSSELILAGKLASQSLECQPQWLRPRRVNSIDWEQVKFNECTLFGTDRYNSTPHFMHVLLHSYEVANVLTNVDCDNSNLYFLQDSVHIVGQYKTSIITLLMYVDKVEGSAPMHAGCLTWPSWLMFPMTIQACAPFLMSSRLIQAATHAWLSACCGQRKKKDDTTQNDDNDTKTQLRISRR